MVYTNRWSAQNTFEPYTRYLLALAFSCGVLHFFSASFRLFPAFQLFSAFPLAAVLCADLVLCGFIASLFPGIRYRWLIFLYPILICLITQSFAGNWFDAGDGPAHTPVSKVIFGDGLFVTWQSVAKSYSTGSIFVVAKTLSLGASLGYVLVFYLFGLPTIARYQDVFIASQGFVYICLVSLVATFIKKCGLLDNRFAFMFVAFLVLSPTVLEGNSVPNRHLVTIAGLSLLCVTHLALFLKVTPDRIVLYCLAIAVVILSKAPLLLPYMAFAVLASGSSFLWRNRVISSVLILAGIFVLPDWLSYYTGLYDAYSDTAVMGMSRFNSGIISTPVIGWIIKYIYALLSPFPWSKFNYFVITNYTGSYLLFFFHILSSLTGVYLFTVVILKWQGIIKLFKTDIPFRFFVLFGLVMSTSILFGATGFHGYLSMLFPFLIPLVMYKNLRVGFEIPFIFVIVCELLANKI